MSAHVVFFAAAALFVAAQAARWPAAGDAWQQPAQAETDTTSLSCIQGASAGDSYLDRLGFALWQAEGASFVREYVGGCGR